MARIAVHIAPASGYGSALLADSTAGSVLLLLLVAIFLLGVIAPIIRSTVMCLGRVLGLTAPHHYVMFPRLPWRVFLRPLLGLREVSEDMQLGGHETTRWSSFLQRSLMMYRRGDIMVGRQRLMRIPLLGRIPLLKLRLPLPLLMPIGLRTRLHVLMVAGAGAGKSNTLATMIALHEGNVFVVDPAGELANLLKDRCGKGAKGIIGKGRRSLVLDPRGLVPSCKSASWNLFEEMERIASDRGPEELVSYTRTVGHALIVQSENDDNEALTAASRDFVVAVILHVYSSEYETNKTLTRVYEIINLRRWPGNPPTKHSPIEEIDAYMVSLDGVLLQMANNQSFAGAIQRGIADIEDLVKEDRHGDRLLSAREQLQWLADPKMGAISDRSTFNISELQSGDLSLFVCAEASMIKTHLKGWFRLITTLALEEFERNVGQPPNVPTMFAIDEMPSLGNISAVDNAAPVLRKAGVQLVCITQDLQRLKSAYEKTWEGFLTNMGITMWMAPNSYDAKELQEMLGGQTLFDRLSGRTVAGNPTAWQRQLQVVLRDHPKNRNNVLVLPRGRRPILLCVAHYYRELPVYYYATRTDIKTPETKPRRITRLICEWLISAPASESTDVIGRPTVRIQGSSILNPNQHVQSRSHSGAVATNAAAHLVGESSKSTRPTEKSKQTSTVVSKSFSNNALPPQTEERDLSLLLLVDCSIAMGSHIPIPDLSLLVARLLVSLRQKSKDDRISLGLIDCSENARVLLPLSKVSVIDAMPPLSLGASSNYASGLDLACKEFAKVIKHERKTDAQGGASKQWVIVLDSGGGAVNNKTEHILLNSGTSADFNLLVICFGQTLSPSLTSLQPRALRVIHGRYEQGFIDLALLILNESESNARQQGVHIGALEPVKYA